MIIGTKTLRINLIILMLMKH